MKRRWLLSLLLLTLVVSAAPAWADVAADHYNRGNRLFADGQYAEALAAYQAALDSGADDAAAYLNFGNAAFRLNEVGLAIWAYEMGLRLEPRNDDLRFNLRYAGAFMRDELPPADEVFILRVGRALAGHFTADEALAGAAAGWLLGGLAVLLWGPWRRFRRRTIALGVLGALLLAFFAPIAAVNVHRQAVLERAVVVADEVVVRTGPAQTAKEAFTVHAGMRLELIETRDDYTRVRIPTGFEGWLPTETYRALRRDVE